MNYWLLKTDPETYSFEDLLREKRTVWDGIRNPQARTYLAAMEVGDVALIYHSGSAREVVGMARVVQKAYPDPKDPRWVAIDVEAISALPASVTMSAIKATPSLQGMRLVKQSRLSVMPVTEGEFHAILRLARGE